MISPLRLQDSVLKNNLRVHADVAVLRKGRIAELHQHIAELEEDNRNLRDAREGEAPERKIQEWSEVRRVERALITAA